MRNKYNIEIMMCEKKTAKDGEKEGELERPRRTLSAERSVIRSKVVPQISCTKIFFWV